MISLSLCMIVKNEEDVLARCLDCIQGIADEIIIIDTGSTDATKQIALQYTDKVYDFAWNDDFSAARNFSFQHAAMEYILWLDADDVISPENQKLLLELKNTLDPSVDIVMMKYDVAFDLDGTPTMSYNRERILKRSKNFQWLGEIHETIPPSGNILYSDIAIWHKKLHRTDPERNLRIFEKMLADGKKLDARQQFYYARELYYHSRITEAVQMFEAFLNQDMGWLENKIEACRNLAKCLRLQNQSPLPALLKSFTYDQPRAEICCDIGAYFMEQKNYRTAVFWYTIAAGIQPDLNSGGFVSPDYYGYIPNIQLAVCYDHLGEYEKANQCNEKAGAYKPNDKSYVYNRNYFKTILKETKGWKKHDGAYESN